VKLADFSPARVAQFSATSGLTVRRAIPQLSLVLVETADNAAGLTQAESGVALAAAAAALSAVAGVAWAEPNYILMPDLIPSDPHYYNYQSLYLTNRLEMPAAWDFTTGRADMVAAVLDTGVNVQHEDLTGGIWTNPLEIPANGVDDDGNGFVDDVNGWNFALNNNVIADDYGAGHGTHVSGIIAARINNNKGIAGMAGGVTIMPVKVFPPSGFGTYEDLIRGIIYAPANGARVINMSLGATSYSRGEEAAVDYAWAHGAVVVAAAGNQGSNVYHYPAAHPNVIAVAATDVNDQRASFSNWGDFIDVAAPGSSVYSTYRTGNYGPMSGTSMASPHVAGLAALIFSLNPQLTNAQVRQIIEANADDLGSAGWDPYFGHGRINGRQALAAVQPAPQPSPSPTPHPPLPEWPAGCQDLITDGDFETGLGAWQATGAWSVDATRTYSGSQAAHFTGGADATGALTRTLTLLPAGQPATDATLWFAYRIENADGGLGSTPQLPFDDWLTAEWRTTDGKLIGALLRTGNSADTASDGLPWDRYLYRLQSADLAPLNAFGTINLVFTAGNDADALPTNFWLDAVRFCAAWPAPPTVTPTPTATPTVPPTPTATPPATPTRPGLRTYLPVILTGP
jgi:subtilisin family serine protease